MVLHLQFVVCKFAKETLLQVFGKVIHTILYSTAFLINFFYLNKTCYLISEVSFSLAARSLLVLCGLVDIRLISKILLI